RGVSRSLCHTIRRSRAAGAMGGSRRRRGVGRCTAPGPGIARRGLPGTRGQAEGGAMSGMTPPDLPSPGEGWRQYPAPMPGDEALAPDAGQPIFEPDVIEARQAERRRREDLVDLLTEDHRTTDSLLAALG